MLKSLNQRGITPIIIIIIILGGLVSATYLIQQQTNLFPQAKEKSSSKKSNEATAQKKQKTGQSSSRRAIQAVREANQTLREGLSRKDDQLLIEAGAQTVTASNIAYVELSTEAQSPAQNETREKKKEKLTKSVELLALAHGQAVIAQKSIQRDGNREKLKTYAENLTSQVNENAPTVEAAFNTQDLNQIQTAVDKHLKLAGLEGASKGQSDFANDTITDEDLTLIDRIKNFLIPPTFAQQQYGAGTSVASQAHASAAQRASDLAAAQANFNRAAAAFFEEGKSMEASGYGAASASLAQAERNSAYASAISAAFSALATASNLDELEAAKTQAYALADLADSYGNHNDAQGLRDAADRATVSTPGQQYTGAISFGNFSQLEGAISIGAALDSAMGSYSVDSFDAGSSGGSFDSSGIGTSDIGSSDTGGSTDSNSSPGE